MLRKENNHTIFAGRYFKNLIIAMTSAFAACSAFSAPIHYPLTNLSGAKIKPIFSKKLPPDFQLPVKNGKFLSWDCSGSDINAHCVATGYTWQKDSANKNYIPLVISSIDGGITWTEHMVNQLPPCIHWGPISCTLDVSFCIATGVDDFSAKPMVIAQSTDNMQTWDTKHFSCAGSNNCRFQVSTCSGEKDHTLCIAAAAESNYEPNPLSIQTKDLGKTWTDIHAGNLSIVGFPYASECTTQDKAVHCSIKYRWDDLHGSLEYFNLFTLDTGSTWHLT